MTRLHWTTVGGASAAVLVLLLSQTARAATYYVAPDGSDAAAGTMDAPFASWSRAQTAAAAGDTVYFRGGTYTYTAATSTCGGSTTATVNSIVLTKSGTSGKPINYWAYQGETPVFDFSGLTDTSKYNCRQTGVRIQADWLYLKGLEFMGVLQLNMDNHESWCVYLDGGSNNTFELLDAHHNMGPGFFIQRGGNNTFLNCDSHENEDTMTSNGDGQSADGFGCHPNRAGDTGNIFRGCRAWWNSDDGWDFINSQEACTVENSWAWYGGYKPDTLNNGAPVSLAAGNGNGFKVGGYGDPQTGVPATPPQHVVRFSVAFYNKANGIYANHGIVSPFVYNNTSFNNGTDIDMLGLDGTTVTSVGTLRNNIGYSNNGHAVTGDLGNAGPISDQFNSWDASVNVKVTDADFQSVAFKPATSCPPTDMTCFAGMASARQADGSLPVVPFLRLAATSALIDKGMDIGFPYGGTAPDLGAFESGTVTTTGSGGAGASPGSGGAGPGSGGRAAGGASGSGGAGGTGRGGTTATGGRSGAGTGGTPSSSGGAGAGRGGMPGGGGGTGTGGFSNGSGGAPTGSGGAANGSGGASSTGGGTGGGTGQTDGGDVSGASGGCSCAAARTGGAGGDSAALAMFLLAVALGRRRRSAA
jgi:MYXO-CTERM domain-containing protein